MLSYIIFILKLFLREAWLHLKSSFNSNKRYWRILQILFKKYWRRSSQKMEKITEETHGFKPLVFTEVEVEPLGGNHVCPPLSGPDPRSGHRTVCDDANMYAYGGYLRTESLGAVEQRLFEELWCFNFAEERWKFLPAVGNTHTEVASHCAILYGNFLHVFGGTGVIFGESTSNELHTCDLRSLQWEKVSTFGEAPKPQYGQAVVLDEARKCIYVIGGTTGFEFSMDVHMLHLPTKTWEALYICNGDQAEPRPRYRHEVAFDGKNIYVFGGGTATSAFGLKIVPIFNLETRKWKKVSTKGYSAGNLAGGQGGDSINGIDALKEFPLRRKCFSSVQMGDDVYICGGCNNQTVYQDIWRFNIPKRQWHFLPIQMPTPLSFHAASLTSEGCMYVFGGVTSIKRGVRTNQVFKIWLKIPKLKEMCWDVLLRYNKNLKTLKREALMDIGIPYDFAKRVHPSPPSGKPHVGAESLWDSDLLKTSFSCSCDPANEDGSSSPPFPVPMID
ncbi:unnamed protein product [Orchesella dallaii]|uniref:Kelch domain-containing protein 10 n=1 Tax=Orchesella dallaii TaxID=48710 RepID=A0ABP1QSP3_9HEXA